MTIVAAEENVPLPSSGKKRRRWGSKPLSLDLLASQNAVKAARNLVSNVDEGVREASLALAVGNSLSSSAFKSKAAALRSFGLIADESKGFYRLTELGRELATPTSPESETGALQAALSHVSVYGKIIERHRGKILPDDEFLRNLIEQECQIGKEDSGRWVQDFRRDAKSASMLHDQGGGRIILSEGCAPTPIIEAQVLEKRIKKGVPPESRSSPTEPRREAADAFGYTARIQLSGGKVARFSIPDQLSAADVEKLKKSIEGFGAILESMTVSRNQ